MRTNIEIDDALMAQAMTVTGLTTKRATVEAGLCLLVQVHNQTQALEALSGLGWEELGQSQQMVPVAGIEPATSSLQNWRSTN